jgi:hypothetical protein
MTLGLFVTIVFAVCLAALGGYLGGVMITNARWKESLRTRHQRNHRPNLTLIKDPRTNNPRMWQ